LAVTHESLIPVFAVCAAPVAVRSTFSVVVAAPTHVAPATTATDATTNTPTILDVCIMLALLSCDCYLSYRSPKYPRMATTTTTSPTK
jgi:hypothetical protein